MSLISITLTPQPLACVVLSPGFQPGQARSSGLVSGEPGGRVAFQASERLVAAFGTTQWRLAPVTRAVWCTGWTWAFGVGPVNGDQSGVDSQMSSLISLRCPPTRRFTFRETACIVVIIAPPGFGRLIIRG